MSKIKVLCCLAIPVVIVASCKPAISQMCVKARKNLEASLDYPKQLKVLACSAPDSAFGVNYFSKQEITGMLKVMNRVTNQLVAKTKDINDLSKIDAYTASLIRRQMNTATDVQKMIFQNVPKGEWSGWKVKIDYSCVDSNGIPYRAERWVFFDKDRKSVVKTFEIPLP